MFARKDLERDVLSAYQRHRQNLRVHWKKTSADSQSSDSDQPRTLQVDTAKHAGDAEGSAHTKSPSSEFDNSYTYTQQSIVQSQKGRIRSIDGLVEDTMDRGHEAAQGAAEAHE